MIGPFFQKQSWAAFTYEGQTYELTHLDEYAVEIKDSAGEVRRIAITFSDHCFTKEPVETDDPGLRYPESTRPRGNFCIERYHLSLGLPQHLAHAMRDKVWNIRDGTFAAVPVINHRGEKVLYGIVFSLDPVKGFPLHLHLRVETAYPCDESELTTYGHIRFTHLVTLRMRRKSPNRNFDRHRPKPRLE